MKLSKLTLLVVGLSLAAGSTLMAQSWGWGADRDHKVDEQAAKLRGVIIVPGNPIASTDIAWGDDATGLFMFSDRSNAGVDILNGRTDLYIGRATTNSAATIASTTVASQAIGAVHFQGLPTTSPVSGVSASHWEGPNGVVTTNDKKAFAADGDSTVKVIDLDPTSPTYQSVIAVVSTAIPGASGCTGGFGGSCERADELAYDSIRQIIFVANDEPETIAPYVTFISAVAPYTVLGHFNFTAAPVNGQASGGLEQPVFDPEAGHYLQTVPVTGSSTSTTGSVVIYSFNPSNGSVTIDKVINLASEDCSPTGEALAPNQHLVVSCGNGGAAGTQSSFPLVIDLRTGSPIGSMITGVGGGDEINYNADENEFISSSSLDGVTAGPGNPLVLGVINANNGELINTAPPATPAPTSTTDGTGGLATTGRAGNLAAVGKRTFVVVHPATSPASDVCGKIVSGTTSIDPGCVAVFGPTGPGEAVRDDDHDRDDRGRNDHGRDDHGFGGFGDFRF